MSRSPRPAAALSTSPAHPHARPFAGTVDTTVHALRLVHAARLGVIPRVMRRLNDQERREMVGSGAVFIFAVEESGMKRWTDGRGWSPSRIDGNFLVYKEMNDKNSGLTTADRFEEWRPEDGGSRGVWVPHSQTSAPHSGQSSPGGSRSSRSRTPTTAIESGPKIGGLVKKTITVKINHLDHHLIAYHTQADLDSGRLLTITSRPDIMSLSLPSHIFRFADFRLPPRVEVGADGAERIVCEPDTMEEDPPELSPPPQSPIPGPVPPAALIKTQNQIQDLPRMMDPPPSSSPPSISIATAPMPTSPTELELARASLVPVSQAETWWPAPMLARELEYASASLPVPSDHHDTPSPHANLYTMPPPGPPQWPPRYPEARALYGAVPSQEGMVWSEDVVSSSRTYASMYEMAGGQGDRTGDEWQQPHATSSSLSSGTRDRDQDLQLGPSPTLEAYPRTATEYHSHAGYAYYNYAFGRGAGTGMGGDGVWDRG